MNEENSSFEFLPKYKFILKENHLNKVCMCVMYLFISTNMYFSIIFSISNISAPVFMTKL